VVTAKVGYHKLALEPQAVIAYDNFNFKDTVHDQVLGSSKSVMRNMTSGLLIVSPSLPSSGLKQSMIDPKQPLTLNDILLLPGLHRDQVSKGDFLVLYYGCYS